jgi:hypothetical protein
METSIGGFSGMSRNVATRLNASIGGLSVFPEARLEAWQFFIQVPYLTSGQACLLLFQTWGESLFILAQQLYV